MSSPAPGLAAILAAIVVLGLSGLPACLLPRRSLRAQRLTVALMLAGSALGLYGVALALGAPGAPVWRLPWRLPWGEFAVAVDPLSAVFLLPVFVVPVLGSLYGLGYWSQAEHGQDGRWLGAFYGLVVAAIALVLIARDGVLFLMAWEVMALAAFFALVSEQHKPEVRQAGWVYLVATHLGTLCLFAMFATWRHATGTYRLEPGLALASGTAGPIFVLALIGFGCKAGLFPLHFWLPGAHASAPSHLSALMSGVLLKAGVYGLVRMSGLLSAPPLWWGGILLAAGTLTGLLGIVFAIGQHDLKRMLAYSSVENIGIIAMGLGLALIGRTLDQADWMLLGLCAALLHVWNHSLFKALLFLDAGAILHATGTRLPDRLGGLAPRMPRAAGLFAVGAVAICALPPLNGFAGEWLLYVGLFRTLGLEGGPSVPAAAAAAVLLAAIGALALACFVRAFGTIFLGTPRGSDGEHAHDPPASMLGPMAVLALGCLALGILPHLAAPLLQRAATTWAPGLAAMADPPELPPLEWISTLGMLLLAVVVLLALALKRLSAARSIGRSSTWSCGYARPTARMQYTGSSFTQVLAQLSSFLTWPRRVRGVVTGLFARPVHVSSETPDLVLDRLFQPASGALLRLLPWLRRVQQGSVHAYLVYMLLTILLLFLIGA